MAPLNPDHWSMRHAFWLGKRGTACSTENPEKILMYLVSIIEKHCFEVEIMSALKRSSLALQNAASFMGKNSLSIKIFEWYYRAL